MIQIGNDKIKEIYVGSDKIKEVYHGGELVYTVHDPRGYWVHKDTGVKTYFGLDASFISNGIMNTPPWVSDCSEVKIPSGVTSLEHAIFMDCYSLTSVIIPEGVAILGQYCFFSCTSLTSITLPESVVSLGLFCFMNCTSLILATVLPATPPTLGDQVFDYTHESFNIKVRSPYVDAYKTATNWNQYSSIISAI